MSSAVLFALLTVAATPKSSGAEAEQFKKLFLKGDALYQRGEYASAIAQFREADALRLTPEVAFNLAKCHERLQDPAQATYYYRLYLRRAPKAKDAPAIQALVDGALARAAEGGKGYLELEGPGARSGTVGAQTFPQLPLGLFLPPGAYEVSAQFPEGTQRQKLQVEVGKVTRQHFASSGPAVASAVREAREASSAGSKEVVRTASYLTLGTAAAALAVGSVMGSMSARDARLLHRQDLTVSQAQALAQSANSKGRTANVLWISGAATAAVGGALLVFSMPEPGLTGGGSP